MDRVISYTYYRPIVIDDYLCKIPEILELQSRNQFLAGLISGIQRPRDTRNYKLAKPAAAILADLFMESSLDKEIHSFDDFSKDPYIFWRLIDQAHKHCVTTKMRKNLGIWAVCFLYKCMAHAAVLDNTYINHPKSVYYVVGLSSFWEILYNPNITVNKYYQVDYNNDKHPCALVFDCKSEFLLERIYISSSRHRIDYGQPHLSWKIARYFEDNFEDASMFKDHRDFTVQRLNDGIKHIYEKYSDNREYRLFSMKLLFNIWGDLILDYPEYDFFKNSRVWCVEAILNGHTSRALVDGYKPIVCQELNDIPMIDKIMFITHNTNKRTSTGSGYSQHLYDFSDVEDERWRLIAINYTNHCLFRGQRQSARIKSVISDVITPIKKGSDDEFYMTGLEINKMVSIILSEERKQITNLTILQWFKTFLNWCQKNEFIRIQPGALKAIVQPPAHREIHPSSLSIEEIEKLDKAFQELGKTRPRFLLSRCAFFLQLNSTTRTGEILSMKISNIHFNKEGWCTVTSMSKNNFQSPREQVYSVKATEIIREAMRLSKETRERWPNCESKDCLFLFANNKYNIKRYAVINTNRFLQDLKIACKKAGIRRITSGNIRDTSITALKKFARQENLTTLERQNLLGHISIMSANHYDDIDFRDILEASDNIELGTLIKEK